MPLGNSKNVLSHSSVALPYVSIATHPSAPHSIPKIAIAIMSTSLCELLVRAQGAHVCRANSGAYAPHSLVWYLAEMLFYRFFQGLFRHGNKYLILPFFLLSV